jgi:hypothetical protein
MLLVLASGLASARPRDAATSIIELAKLTASDGADGDEFGYSVSISGDTVVVGAYLDGGSSGSAYVFERDAGGPGDWGQVAKLTASDGAGGDLFGWSVSTSGDAVVVGAHGDDGKGAAYVFERDAGGPGNWGQVAKLTASDGASGSGLGAAVSIRAGSVVAGAPGDDSAGNNFGAAYVFERPVTGWTDTTETAKLIASDGVENAYFGMSVSIGGDTLAVGAFRHAGSGAVYVFERDAGGPGNWGQVAKLTGSDGFENDYLGQSVSISSDTVVAGAYGDDDAGDQSGSVYLFEKPGTGWADMNETAKLTASDGTEGDSFGYSASVSGATVVVGAHGDDPGGDFAGSAYLFTAPGAGWADMTETAKITASDGAEQDYFGWSVANSGGEVIAGARLDDDMGAGSGSAYLFFRPTSWVYLPVVLRGAP